MRGIESCIPYSRKYWWSLNLVVLPQMTFLTPFADLNLAVWYGIAIRTCMRKNIWRILIWQLDDKPPNRQIFWLYGISHFKFLCLYVCLSHFGNQFARYRMAICDTARVRGMLICTLTYDVYYTNHQRESLLRTMCTPSI